MTAEINQIEIIDNKDSRHNCGFNFERAIPFSLDEKITNLNKAALVRGGLFKYQEKINGKVINQGIRQFIKEMKQPINNGEHDNSRVLSLIFFLAEVPQGRHKLEFDELTKDEQIRLIHAINQLKAVASIFPKDLAIK